MHNGANAIQDRETDLNEVLDSLEEKTSIEVALVSVFSIGDELLIHTSGTGTVTVPVSCRPDIEI